MEVDQDEEVLRLLADGKTMDYSLWPEMLPRLIERLEKIIQTEFLIPPSLTPKIPSSTQSTQSVNEDTQPRPASQSSFSLPGQLMTFYLSITTTLQKYFAQKPPHTIQRLSELLLEPKQHYRTLPSYLHALDRVVHVTSPSSIFPLPPAVPDPSSLSILSNGTVQAGIDPLSLSWGQPSSAAAMLGSDESLGGALLTPIPWLTTKHPSASKSPELGSTPSEPILTPDSSTLSLSPSLPLGDDDISAALRAEGGVTQGELLRQEQKAGVVPAAQLSHKGNEDGTGEDEETPHARGPDEVGAEDIGPQNLSGGSNANRGVTGAANGSEMVGIDIDSAVGRTRNLGRAPRVDVAKGKGEEDDEEDSTGEKAEDSEEVDAKDSEMSKESEAPGTPKREAEDEIGGVEKKAKAESNIKDGEGDTEIVDADGKTADEPKFGEAGETKGADAVDTTTV